MTATVTIEIARADDVLRVPNAALRFRPDAETLAAVGRARHGPARAADRQPAPARRRHAGGVDARRRGLRRVTVQTGINDGTTTAITGGDLRTVRAWSTGCGERRERGASGGSPLLPQRPADSSGRRSPGAGRRR